MIGSEEGGALRIHPLPSMGTVRLTQGSGKRCIGIYTYFHLYFLERKKKERKRKSISIKISISRRLPLQGKRTSSSNVNQKPVSFPPKASTRRGCDQGTGQHSPPVERDTKQRHQFRYGRVRSGVTPSGRLYAKML